MIPTENDLMERFGVSRTTVRQSLAALVTDGLLYRQQGKGTFVAPARIEQSLDRLVGFLEALLERGLTPEIQARTMLRESPQPEVAWALGLGDGERVWELARQVAVRGEPLFWDHSYLVERLGVAPSERDLQVRPLFQWLEASGVHLAKADLTMAARPATAEECGVLRLPAGSPVIVIHRTVYGEDGRPLLFSRVIYRADRYQYQIRLTRQSPHGWQAHG